MPASIKTFSKYTNKIFVETGSHIGDGIQIAISSGFNNIISIEILEEHYNICKKRFTNNNVKLYLGDSSKLLYDIIKDINHEITFWLDGHYDDYNGRNKISPLIEEIEQIKKHHINTHTIMIDDVRLFNSVFGFSVEKIKEKLREINNDYLFLYEDGNDNPRFKNDVLVAKIQK